MQNKILESLKQIALKRSQSFCYSCYKLAPTGCCETCGSNDLMRHLSGVGVEYGTEWIIKHIIETELTPVNTEEAFEQYVEACYPDYVQVGWLSYDVCSILKELDPVTWDLAKAEFINSEESEGNYISLDKGASYYLVSDVKEFIDGEDAE